MQERIKQQIKNSVESKYKLLESPDILSDIEKTAQIIINAFRNGHKLLLAGNGGSAADAQHIAAELVNRFAFDRPGLPAIALTTNSSVMTSISNDYGYDGLFARQINALGSEGDIFIGISTSGSSTNIIHAFSSCREKKIISVGFTGSMRGKMNELCDICINVPSNDTPRIQEMHILIAHIICSIIEQELFGKSNRS